MAPEPAGGVPRAREGTFPGADGTPLFYAAWEAPAPAGVLLLSHGIGEHSGRYDAFARELAALGVSTYALDHRGNGRSPGQRGHVGRFGEFVADLEAFRRAVVAPAAGARPVFLFGHSLGGLVALRHLEEHPGAAFAGAVLSAPALGVAVEAPRWKVALAHLLTHVVPSLPFSNHIDPALLSHDGAYVERYRDDPLVHPRITPRLYPEIQAATRAALRDAPRIRVPLLFVVPGDDRIVRSVVTEELARSLTGDVTVHLYPGLYHECLNEVERERVVRDITAWIAPRLA